MLVLLPMKLARKRCLLLLLLLLLLPSWKERDGSG
jgi:hypothetical protein